MNNKCVEKHCANCRETKTGYICDYCYTMPNTDPDTCGAYEENTWDFTKPPLGAPPAFIPAEHRIKELADAISRASVEGRNYTGHISLWAKEILMQCRIIQYVKEEDDT